jgi:hypothetical protein
MNNIVLLIVENKASLGCGLGKQFAFIKKKRVKNMNGQ